MAKTDSLNLALYENRQICHSGKDSMQRTLVAGQKYYFSQPGRATQVVQIFEDESTGDLAFQATHNGQRSMYRVDECSQHCTFSRQLGTADDNLVEKIEHSLKQASQARRQLSAIETDIASCLNCYPGDGSETWDAISACVRDGLGTAFDLAQLVGE